MRASILITDDDRGFRETLRGVFEPEGFRTLMAEDGAAAVDIVRSSEVHLLLLDMHMPRLTGLETLRIVKQMKSRLPCILLSALPDEGLVREAMQADAFSFLTKPVSRQTITTTVHLALAKTYDWAADAVNDHGIVDDHRLVERPGAERGARGQPDSNPPRFDPRRLFRRGE